MPHGLNNVTQVLRRDRCGELSDHYELVAVESPSGSVARQGSALPGRVAALAGARNMDAEEQAY